MKENDLLIPVMLSKMHLFCNGLSFILEIDNKLNPTFLIFEFS